MADEIKNLKRRRGVVKGKLTNFEKFLDKCKSDEFNDELIIELESRLERMNDLLDNYEEIQSEIELLSVGESVDIQNELVDDRNSFENLFFKLIAIGKNMLDKKRNNKDDSSSSRSSQGSVLGVALQARPKLPSIPIPKFGGNMDEWMEFKDTFQSLIHNNTAIADVEKFHFLKQSLHGEPEKMVKMRKMTAENYEIVWQLLCDRYDDKPSLVGHHLDSILEFKSMNKESATHLRAMLDTIVESLFALEKLDVDTASWDPFLIHLMEKKLDQVTFSKWEEFRPKKELVTLDQFKKFLESRVDSLKNIERNKKDSRNDTKNQGSQHFWKNKTHKSFINIESEPFCEFCKDRHFISNCNNFLKLKVYGRYQQVRRLGLCLNCLHSNHISKVCMSGGCRKCGKKHHTLLHYEPLGEKEGRQFWKKTQVENNEGSNKCIGSQSGKNDSPHSQGHASTNNGNQNGGEPNLATQSSYTAATSVSVNTLWLENGEEVSGEVLLSTALIQVVDCNGRVHNCRALLDTGSQPNLITDEFVERVGLSKNSVEVVLAGIGNKPSPIRYRCSLMIQSNRTGFKKNVSCLVVPKICGLVPSQNIPVKNLVIPDHIQLADPGFSTPGQIDLLLGVDIFYEILCVGQIRLGTNLPILQKTRLGWIVTGNMRFFGEPSKTVKCNLNLVEMDEQLEKFWSLEEVPVCQEILSKEDLECEKIFIDTTTIGSDGKFVVRIPLKRPVTMLGQSRQAALNLFYKLEKKLEKDERLGNMYRAFMKEYMEMGHMSLSSTMSHEADYYFPHHGVLNETSETTRLRVVFNGSASTETGISFNDLQFNGPKLQEDLVLILLRFRQHSVVVCGDIEKMYRMIWVAPDQRCFQKVWWRSSPEEEVSEYTLNTVTYGTRSAPYLAIRCLKEVGVKCKESNPEVSRVILKDFYVDDLLTGTESKTEAIRLCKGVTQVLKERGMKLRKWVSNDQEVQLTLEGTEGRSESVHFGEKNQNKTLGLVWAFKEDTLKFIIDFPPVCRRHTKRSILSEVSRIFDPLGLVGPSVVLAKILLQKLWQEKIDWDESLPCSLETEWKKLRAEFLYLNGLQIVRHTLCKNPVVVEIHGFSDASVTAYGACVYLSSIGQGGVISVNLLCSKGRVAPLKSQTIPRLELCGALLLAKLVATVKSALTVKVTNTYFWTDSTVVLGWLEMESCKLQVFVANRVSQIQSLSKVGEWRHVRSEHNPADLVSRGVLPSKLVEVKKWWFGPNWLKLDKSEWPNSVDNKDMELPELRQMVVSHSAVVGEKFHFERFSNLNRLRRAVAYCMRFVARVRSKMVNLSDPLTPIELEHAMNALIALVQKESFGLEIEELVRAKSLSNKNLQSLSPFLDESGLLRVGGRLKLAAIPYNKRHPLLLSSKHRFTRLLCEMEHVKLLHCGPQLLLSHLRETYWILGGRNIVRKITKDCVRCFRAKPLPLEQIMGDLPQERVHITPPFYVTGTDYAGPFSLKTKCGRRFQLCKGYICLFVCFSTKALHFEVVSDLTSEAFIACLRRFISRRGKPKTIFSDNGSNYVGANHELKELQIFLENETPNLTTILGNEGIEWKFIPAHAPNFGGLWESGVRSCKHHLKRVLGNISLTYEDFSTLLVQIEAVLNSRPLVPMSSSPNDFDVLTPSHFLIGRRLTSIADPSLEGIQINRLSRWQHIQMITQHFWKRWSLEYLAELQRRNKWTKEWKNLEIGQLVLIKDDNLPPLQWKLGRVKEVFCGPDGNVRVALLKTQLGEYKRSISKICPLPVTP